MLHARLLTYLDEVARCGTIRGAARKLNVTSSAINRQILALEQDLGVLLFERLTRRLRLTAAGELVIAHVRETLRGHERVMARIDDLSGLHWGRVTVATVATIAAEAMPSLIASFRAARPRTTVDVQVVADVVAAIRNEEAELGIGFDLAVPAGLEIVFELPVRLGVVVPPGHPLIGQESVGLASCAPYPLIQPSPAMSMQPIVELALHEFRDQISTTILSNSVELMKNSVRLGQGIAFLTYLNVARDCAQGDLVFLPLSDRTTRRLQLRLIRKTRPGAGPLAEIFADEMRRGLPALLDPIEAQLGRRP